MGIGKGVKPGRIIRSTATLDDVGGCEEVVEENKFITERRLATRSRGS